MVLILGNKEDPCACWTKQVLQERGHDVLFLDESDLMERTHVSWASTLPPRESVLEYEGCRVRLDEVTGVLARTWNVWVKDPEMTEKDQLYASFEIQAALSGILSYLPCRVINRPVLGMSYSPIFSHRETYGAVLEAGFTVPRTMVTSNAQTALAFYEENGRKAVMGSPSNLLPRRLLEGEAGVSVLQTLPDNRAVYLQAIPEGRWAQAYVVGERAFASESDWSPGEGAKQMPDVPLAPAVSEMACRLASAIRLDFAELQIFIGQDGATCCYDVNPYPRYWHCSEARRDEITQAVATLLETI